MKIKKNLCRSAITMSSIMFLSGQLLYADNWTTGTSGKITSGSTTNIGIGTTNTGSKMQINGNAAVGYSSSTAAPTNGLAVSGNVGVGTTTTGSKLQVNGNVAIGYSGSTSGPTNGLTVSGRVGIGNTSPNGDLQIRNSFVYVPAPTGTAATDRANIVNAITSVTSGTAPNETAGTVYLQAGNYSIDQTISLPHSIKLVGSGMFKTIISLNNSAVDIAIDATDRSYITVSDLSIWGSGTRIHTGLNLQRTAYANIENVRIDNMATGVYVSHSFNNFRNIEVLRCATGVLLGSTVNNGQDEWATANIFMGGHIHENTVYGIRCVEAWGNTFNGITIERNQGTSVIAGLSLESGIQETQSGPIGIVGNNTVVGCFIECNSGAQIRISSPGNSIIGCYMSNNCDGGTTGTGPFFSFAGTNSNGNLIARTVQINNTGASRIQSPLMVTALPECADNTDALADGLRIGEFYRTGDALKVVH